VGGLADVGTLIATDAGLTEQWRTSGIAAGERLGAVFPDTFNTGPDPIFFDSGADTNGLTNNGSIVKVSQDTGAEILRVAGTKDNEFLGSDRTNLAGNDVLIRSDSADVGGLVDAGRAFIIGEAGGGAGPAGNVNFGDGLGSSQNVSVGSVLTVLNSGGHLILQANTDITLALGANLLVSAGGTGGDLTLQAGRSVVLNADIFTDNGDLTVVANETAANGVVTADRVAGAAHITQAPGSSIDTGMGDLTLTIANGAGRAGAQAQGGEISVSNLSGYNVALNNFGSDGSVEVSGAGTSTGALVHAMDTLTVDAGDLSVLAGNQSGESAVLKGGNLVDIHTRGDVRVAGGTASHAFALVESLLGNVMIEAGDLLFPGTVSLIQGSGLDADAVIVAGEGLGTVHIQAQSCVGCERIVAPPFGNGATDAGIYAGEVVIETRVSGAQELIDASINAVTSPILSMLSGEGGAGQVPSAPGDGAESGGDEEDEELQCSG
ncbi:MAG: hypothetical protein VX663_07915, partial [Pseudomonadota bacterium]|nr:hypothetical protein [Pseudomonadota bacterium]